MNFCSINIFYIDNIKEKKSLYFLELSNLLFDNTGIKFLAHWQLCSRRLKYPLRTKHYSYSNRYILHEQSQNVFYLILSLDYRVMLGEFSF